MTSSTRSYMVSDWEEPHVTRAEGPYVFDRNGKRYLDFVMGWCVGHLGWGGREIRAAMRKFSGPAYVKPYYQYEAWGALAQLLAEITPGKLRRSFRATGGTEAVEIALQVAMLYKGRGRFVSIEGSYHGNSIGTISIADSENRKTYKNLLPNCRKIDPPLDRAAAERVETLLKKRDVAAFIMEPISMNMGVLEPDPYFMRRVRELCTRYGTLLIFDEVACGFGRTGRLFACEHFNVVPDVMCMAKAITGGYAGMGATIVTDEVAEAVKDDANVWSSYGWHPLSVAAATANLRYIKESRKRLLANVNSLGEYFRARLVRMFAEKATVRVRGLAIAVELGDADKVSRVQARCRKAGLLVDDDEDTLLMFPPLNLDRKLAKRGLDILEHCL